MKKYYKKGLALVLAVSMSMASLQAFAADTATETIINEDLTITEVTTTTSTTTDPETGNITVVVDIAKTTDGVNDAGVKVDRDENFVSESIVDSEGNLLEESWMEKGTEIEEWEEAIEAGNENQPEITVTLNPGETTEESETVVEVTGDIPEDDNDLEYDYTTTTTERTVFADTSEVEVNVNKDSTDLTSVKPDAYDGKQDVGGVGGKNSVGTDMLNYYADDAEKVSQPGVDGYDYQHVGLGEYGNSNLILIGCRYIVYERNPETGEALKDAEGNYIIDEEATEKKTKEALDGKLGWQAQQFSLKDSEGNYYYAYCVDRDTGINPGTWYKVENLEDSDYYVAEDSADHLHAIVTNGYWGRNNETDKDGSFKKGSLENIKQQLKEAVKNGDIDDEITVTNQNGKSGTFKLSAIIDDLTEGEALNVTQAAIWTYANGSIGVQDGKDGMIITNPGISVKGDLEKTARMQALYNWLVTLEEEKTASTVVNEDNFVDNLGLTIGNKVSSSEDGEKDVYEAKLNFTLAFTPSKDKDNLLVHISYMDLDGKTVTVTKRLVGTADKDETYGTIIPDNNGNYTIEGLRLREGDDLTFDLRLDGTQYLEQGVYIYSAYGGAKKAQTMVGIAEGTQTVDISTSVTISFTVDESNKIRVERAWFENDSETYEVETETEETETETANDVDETESEEETETESVPGNENWTPGGGDGTVEIEDEDVPLADAPETGDIAMMLLAAAAVSGTGFFAVARKKKED